MKRTISAVLVASLLLGSAGYAVAQNNHAEAWEVPLTVRNAASDEQVVSFGMDPAATDGVDDDLGEIPMPPPPPSEVMDIRWVLPGGEETYRDFRSSELKGVMWTLRLQAGSGGYPLTLSWDTDAGLAGNSLRLQDAFGGQLVDVDMLQQSSYELTHTAITQLHVTYQAPLDFTFNLPSRWSMISLPVEPEDGTVRALLGPEAEEWAFYFDGSGYQPVKELEVGPGYWVNMRQASSVVVSGLPVNQLELDMPRRWSMIGVPWGGAAVIDQDPGGILDMRDVWFWSVGYRNPESLAAGVGYWVNLSSAGRLSLVGSTGGSKPVHAVGTGGMPVAEAEAVLWVAAGDLRQALSLGVPDESVVALPPRPPSGLFDVRLQLDGMEAWQAPHAAAMREYPVLVQGTAVDFHWNEPTPGTSPWELVINDQPIALAGAGSVSIDGRIDHVLLRSPGPRLPQILALHQNLPNPFNSQTVIGYELTAPEDVTLVIYNLLGQPVRTLTEGWHAAGVHRVVWDGRDDQGRLAASGVHVYRLTVGEQRIVRRMVMLR